MIWLQKQSVIRHAKEPEKFSLFVFRKRCKLLEADNNPQLHMSKCRQWFQVRNKKEWDTRLYFCEHKGQVEGEKNDTIWNGKFWYHLSERTNKEQKIEKKGIILHFRFLMWRWGNRRMQDYSKYHLWANVAFVFACFTIYVGMDFPRVSLW